MEEEQKEPEKNDESLPSFKNNRELLLFLFVLIKENKKWWLLPMLLVLGVLGVFVSLTGNTSILPAIYALF